MQQCHKDDDDSAGPGHCTQTLRGNQEKSNQSNANSQASDNTPYSEHGENGGNAHEHNCKLSMMVAWNLECPKRSNSESDDEDDPPPTTIRPMPEITLSQPESSQVESIEHDTPPKQITQTSPTLLSSSDVTNRGIRSNSSYGPNEEVDAFTHVRYVTGLSRNNCSNSIYGMI